jgi:hypothetical protein
MECADSDQVGDGPVMDTFCNELLSEHDPAATWIIRFAGKHHAGRVPEHSQARRGHPQACAYHAFPAGTKSVFCTNA